MSEAPKIEPLGCDEWDFLRDDDSAPRADIADALAAALQDMVTIAEFDKWDHALTGREMVIRDAKTALAAWEARK